ncbi:MAG: T9SS type A sorting domain-containing protein, partial [Candidatus Marinimicrobia bacterium]|nr:T9SS type A sorting domain-containing protein [Candidatus Neomarinimicrobiota bacterium]
MKIESCFFPISLVVLAILLISSLNAEVIPTNEWVNFFSANTTFDGSPIPVGAVVNAYDPDGVLCGTFTVHTQGQYGFLLVYRDDTTTPSVDEGADPGDTITFYINDVYAICLVPDDPTWTSNGAIVQINLEGHSNYPPVISDLPNTILFRSDTTHTINLDDFVSDINDIDSDLSWSVSGNDSVSVIINSSTHVAEFSASLTFSGQESLIFTVTDNMAASDCDTIIVEVIPYIRTLDIFLSAGWNLISWDVDTPNDSINVLLSDIMDNIVVVLSFESGGLTFDPMWQQFSTLKFMDYLHGYWIKTISKDTLNITGSEISNNTPINMEAGWNLVSYLPENPDSVVHALGSIMDNVIVVLGFDEGGLTYDPNWPQFSNLQILSSGFGYWIKVTEPCTLIYPDNQVGKNGFLAKNLINLNSYTDVIPTNEWISIFGESANFDDNRLRIGSVIQAKDPNGIICGEYVVEKKGYFGMMSVYRDDPRTEVDEGAKPGDLISMYIDGMKLEESVIWKNFGDVYRIELQPTKNIIPDSYNLSQNFPNPFNPTTNIQYQIPGRSHVNLVIYNILGEQIRILVNEEKGVGYHTVPWDGKNNQGKMAPSGIYFYQIKAGNYIKTQKM